MSEKDDNPQYEIKSAGAGTILCKTPGLKLIDFYRTSDVLAKDVPPYVKPKESSSATQET